MAWTKTITTASGERRYKVQYHAPDGRSHSRTFEKAEDARQFARDLENSKKDGSYLDPKASRLTLAEYWNGSGERPGFLAASPDLRQSTRDLYGRLAANHILLELGGYRLRGLSLDRVNAWVRHLQSKGVNAPTINAAFRLLRTILSRAQAERLIVINPARRLPGQTINTVRLPKPERHEMRFVSAEDVLRLSDAMPDRYDALVLLLGFCGLRVGEALALRVGDVDFLKRKIHVRRTLTETSAGLQFGDPKTAQSRRTVATPTMVSEALAAHLAAFPAGDDQLIFTSAEGGPVRLTNFRRREWAHALEATGLAPLRIHDLRHTAASVAIQAGAHLKQLQSQLGHSTITITADRYGHLYDSMAEELASRVDTLARNSLKSLGAERVPGGPPMVVPLSQEVAGNTI